MKSYQESPDEKFLHLAQDLESLCELKYAQQSSLRNSLVTRVGDVNEMLLSLDRQAFPINQTTDDTSTTTPTRNELEALDRLLQVTLSALPMTKMAPIVIEVTPMDTTVLHEKLLQLLLLVSKRLRRLRMVHDIEMIFFASSGNPSCDTNDFSTAACTIMSVCDETFLHELALYFKDDACFLIQWLNHIHNALKRLLNNKGDAISEDMEELMIRNLINTAIFLIQTILPFHLNHSLQGYVFPIGMDTLLSITDYLGSRSKVVHAMVEKANEQLNKLFQQFLTPTIKLVMRIFTSCKNFVYDIRWIERLCRLIQSLNALQLNVQTPLMEHWGEEIGSTYKQLVDHLSHVVLPKLFPDPTKVNVIYIEPFTHSPLLFNASTLQQVCATMVSIDVTIVTKMCSIHGEDKVLSKLALQALNSTLSGILRVSFTKHQERLLKQSLFDHVEVANVLSHALVKLFNLPICSLQGPSTTGGIYSQYAVVYPLVYDLAINKMLSVAAEMETTIQLITVILDTMDVYLFCLVSMPITSDVKESTNESNLTLRQFMLETLINLCELFHRLLLIYFERQRKFQKDSKNNGVSVVSDYLRNNQSSQYNDSLIAIFIKLVNVLHVEMTSPDQTQTIVTNVYCIMHWLLTRSSYVHDQFVKSSTFEPFTVIATTVSSTQLLPHAMELLKKNYQINEVLTASICTILVTMWQSTALPHLHLIVSRKNSIECDEDMMNVFVQILTFYHHNDSGENAQILVDEQISTIIISVLNGMSLLHQCICWKQTGNQILYSIIRHPYMLYLEMCHTYRNEPLISQALLMLFCTCLGYVKIHKHWFVEESFEDAMVSPPLNWFCLMSDHATLARQSFCKWLLETSTFGNHENVDSTDKVASESINTASSQCNLELVLVALADALHNDSSIIVHVYGFLHAFSVTFSDIPSNSLPLNNTNDNSVGPTVFVPPRYKQIICNVISLIVACIPSCFHTAETRNVVVNVQQIMKELLHISYMLTVFVDTVNEWAASVEHKAKEAIEEDVILQLEHKGNDMRLILLIALTNQWSQMIISLQQYLIDFRDSTLIAMQLISFLRQLVDIPYVMLEQTSPADTSLSSMLSVCITFHTTMLETAPSLLDRLATLLYRWTTPKASKDEQGRRLVRECCELLLLLLFKCQLKYNTYLIPIVSAAISDPELSILYQKYRNNVQTWIDRIVASRREGHIPNSFNGRRDAVLLNALVFTMWDYEDTFPTVSELLLAILQYKGKEDEGLQGVIDLDNTDNEIPYFLPGLANSSYLQYDGAHRHLVQAWQVYAVVDWLLALVNNVIYKREKEYERSAATAAGCDHNLQWWIKSNPQFDSLVNNLEVIIIHGSRRWKPESQVTCYERLEKLQALLKEHSKHGFLKHNNEITAASGLQDVPSVFICPITLKIMEDPVLLADGHSYECEAITTWLQTNSRSPKTNQPLAHKHVATNLALKVMIDEYIEKQHQIYLQEHYQPKKRGRYSENNEGSK